MRYWGTLGETAVRSRWTCGCVKALKCLYYCMLKAVHWNLSFIFFKLVIYFKQYRNVNDIKWIFVFRQVFYNLLIKISQMMFFEMAFLLFWDPYCVCLLCNIFVCVWVNDCLLSVSLTNGIYFICWTRLFILCCSIINVY
jgi:hypothetical protein